jgi:hypothetical protein
VLASPIGDETGADKRLQTIDSTGFGGFGARSPCYDRALIFMWRQV